MLNSQSETTDSHFSRLFIQPYIDDLTVKRGKVFSTHIKPNLLILTINVFLIDAHLYTNSGLHN